MAWPPQRKLEVLGFWTSALEKITNCLFSISEWLHGRPQIWNSKDRNQQEQVQTVPCWWYQLTRKTVGPPPPARPASGRLECQSRNKSDAIGSHSAGSQTLPALHDEREKRAVISWEPVPIVIPHFVYLFLWNLTQLFEKKRKILSFCIHLRPLCNILYLELILYIRLI